MDKNAIMRYLKLEEYYAVYQYQTCARKWRADQRAKTAID